MSDLIIRQDAIDAALTFLVEYCGAAFDEDMQKMLCERLDALPSAEPERIRGSWMMDSYYPDRLICSECTGQFDVWHWESKQMHFCPNCGADMRTKENENV